MRRTGTVGLCFVKVDLSTDKVGLSENMITSIDKPGLLSNKPSLSKHKPTLSVPLIFPRIRQCRLILINILYRFGTLVSVDNVSYFLINILYR